VQKRFNSIFYFALIPIQYIHITKNSLMPNSPFLRSCFCSLLVICFVIDVSAQRAGRRRSVSTTVLTGTIQLDTIKEVRGIRCGYMNTKEKVEVIDEKTIETP
jgi:hypothetical protein